MTKQSDYGAWRGAKLQRSNSTTTRVRVVVKFMGMRRFTRLTNGFSKKIENHVASVALHMLHYNFVRIHQTLRMTPAMAAGVSNRVWEIADIVALLEDDEQELERAGVNDRAWRLNPKSMPA